jgi:hypothetical protein
MLAFEVNGPILNGGRYHDLGGVVSDQSTDDAQGKAVKNLQAVLVKIAQLADGRLEFRKGTSASDYNPHYGGKNDVPGRVGFYTVSALAALMMDGLAAIPEVGDFLGKLGGDTCARDRMRSGITDACNMENVWDAWKAADPDSLKKYVIDPIRKGAAKINSVLQPIVDRLKAGATPSRVPSYLMPSVATPVRTLYRPRTVVAPPTTYVAPPSTTYEAGGAGALLKSPMTWAVVGGVGVVGIAAFLLLRK